MNRRKLLRLAQAACGVAWIAPARPCVAQYGSYSPVYKGMQPDRVVPLPGPGRYARAFAFSPDGSRLLVGHDDGIVRRYDASTGRETGVFPVRDDRDPIHALAYGPDGRTFAAAAAGGEQELPGRVFSKKVFANFDNAVSIFDDEGREVRRLPQMSGRILAVGFSSDGARVAAVDYTYVFKAWRLDDGREVFANEVHKAIDQQGDFSSPRASIAADASRAIVIDNARDPVTDHLPKKTLVRLLEAGAKEARTIETPLEPFYSAAISSDGQRVVTADGLHSIFIWDFATGRRLHWQYPDIPFGVPRENRAPSFLALSPGDGRRIVTGSAKFAWVDDYNWRPTGGPLSTFEGPGGFVRAAAFFPDRVRLASGGWSALKDQFIERPRGGRDARYEPVTIWDVKVPRKP